MNNKLIEKRSITMSAHRFIYMLAGILLLLSCGSDNNAPIDDPGNTTNHYLQLQPNGLNAIKVSCTEGNFVFPFQIKAVGNGSNQGGEAQINSWSEDELKAYNNKEKTSYVLLPSSLYSLTSTEVSFKEGISTMDVEVKFNPSKVFAEFREKTVEYVIALKLSSDKIQVRDSQSRILLSISFDYPTVGLAASAAEVSVNKDLIPVSIGATLDYTVDGVSTTNPWDFVCSFVVPSNAEELVAEYNKVYKTSYQLLPVSNYDLGEGVTFKAGENQANGEITIKREGMAVVNYLLPLQLGHCSNESIICRDEVCYLQVGRTYTNPIISDKSVPDPSVIRAKDGYFYLYATQTKTYWMPVYRSKDLVNWEYQGTAFNKATEPDLPGGGAFWAPEIRFLNGKYVLYYSWAKMNGADISYTAVAVGDTPMGPFPDSKELIGNKEFGSNCIDQFYYEEDGKKYMFFGSFKGIYVTELEDDGLTVKLGNDGKPTLKKQVCGNAFEGTNIYKKGKYYYLFASIGSCCNGVNASYQVVVGRSENLLGPYVDKDGKDMLKNNWELVLEGDGQKWIGPGHNSIIIQDDEGTDWMIYHSYLKKDGEVGGRLGMLDRVLWTDNGWPYIRNCVPSNSELIPVFYN
ncbi:family 43 glycosylhydrolase [Bacteroides thetaiotaomicron]|jgi:arabinan endo-1,5-alpha-L-arabinosidase|uniref:BT-3987-like N-terminal domain-containing protein n=2 Tax=Bacteroides TaxID=816 RepID=A0A679HMC1_BACT4|nr:family 43 glycosylhydrolase [Bacteroides thetaiotaomicron]CDE79890.1 arabinan endo-1 5-alpha-L-arabinosidase [Bacteroides thetaiotaomicron CAG:40]MCB7007193.1 family 43 glycosylhydrolase [Bacteroides thetaiotaomicron]MCB7363187.1 family 43 glycosylhydrolase [Bacteroides thetaiotaomicron]MCM1777691.1 family 43 glycosylhydrolase [Bacteroides thetaiotaomicron]MCQ5018200.1 family 43 glycosylhydrolase [Bacteroides thetaiotaomicron]